MIGAAFGVSGEGPQVNMNSGVAKQPGAEVRDRKPPVLLAPTDLPGPEVPGDPKLPNHLKFSVVRAAADISVLQVLSMKPGLGFRVSVQVLPFQGEGKSPGRKPLTSPWDHVGAMCLYRTTPV